ncbi:MAG: DUF1998 domain-containing protein [Acidimicrobiia bacterium]|nr:DUF1998 domain-containing protein [Acidimicrobiia bacterium]
MSRRAQGQIRHSQVITTYGPGALIDLPEHAAIVGGLETWPATHDLDEIVDARLTGLLGLLTDVPTPRLYAPPPAPSAPWLPGLGIGAWQFPEWFVVQETNPFQATKAIPRSSGKRPTRSRRLVHRKELDDKNRFQGKPTVPTRFVRACPRGHVDDLDWAGFVHGRGERCGQRLWLDERGTTGDLADLVVRCKCGESRQLYEATDIGPRPLGGCLGRRPWLGLNTAEECNLPSRLLIRTASNAYFPQVVAVLSLPDRGTDMERVVRELWNDLEIVEDLNDLTFMKKKPKVAEKLSPFADTDVLRVIGQVRRGVREGRPVKEAELRELLAAPEGFGDDVPVDPNFHARRLPDAVWREPESRFSGSVEAVIQLHRLREVMALIGFTRFEAAVRDIHGDYESDVERAAIALEPSWYPAVENRGEGVFFHLRPTAVAAWRKQPGVRDRIDQLRQQYVEWRRSRGKSPDGFPGGPYILLHTLAHLLIQSLAMRCGYPASSIRERVYVTSGRYGILLYTGSPDAEGTLGGLVQQARHFEDHLAHALEAGSLCSNDPICAQHSESAGLEGRWLLGAACHGCALVAETSCEMRNDYLDRALVVPVLGLEDAAFFPLP